MPAPHFFLVVKHYHVASAALSIPNHRDLKDINPYPLTHTDNLPQFLRERSILSISHSPGRKIEITVQTVTELQKFILDFMKLWKW